MRASLEWLREYVAVDVEVDKLVELLNMSGTKVETIEVPAEAVEGVVVAQVMDVGEHPNADNLSLVDVETGPGAGARVVCGAHNFSIGDRVPYARVGSQLPAGQIGERKIRGEVSAGMLCSGAELGISQDHSGILVLPPDSPLGEDVAQLLSLSDSVLELEITPNRPDCMGMIGIAREVGALLGNETSFPEVEVSASVADGAQVRVELRDEEGCPRYLARYVEGVTIGPSPAWMHARLLASGIRPISNVVDITNYVLMETGQPLHGFDADKVTERTVVVRRAEDGERLRTLDGIERAMSARDLLIADPRGALAIAGVMGGAGSEVSPNTSDLILEAACFDKASISFTSRRHLLRTEASARFERGADIEMPPYAAARAAALIEEIAGGRVVEEVADAYPQPFRPVPITLRPDRTKVLLGVDIEPERQASYLRSVDLDATSRDGVIEVAATSFRRDLTREVDLIEEVARLHGYDRLPSTLPPGAIGGLGTEERAQRRLKRALSALGLFEAWTPSFMSEEDPDRLAVPEGDPIRSYVKVANPMSEEEAALRTTLLLGLLTSVRRNLARGADGVALFEVARVYGPSSERLPVEPLTLAVALTGVRRRSGWSQEEQRWDLFGAKGVLEAALAGAALPPIAFTPGGDLPFHPTRAATLFLGSSVVGRIGQLHPDVCETFDIPEQTIAFELLLEPIFAALPGRPIVGEMPRFPPVYMDIAVVVDDAVPAATVQGVIRESGAPELSSVRLFDLYTGAQISSGKKSLAYALELRVPDRTLTDGEATAVRDRIVGAVRERTGGELRS